MAGKRLVENNQVSSESPLLGSDFFVVANVGEDRIISFAELTRILHAGVDDIESYKFVSDEDLASITQPENAKYRFNNGKIQFYNDDDSQWYDLKISTSGGRTLSWGNYKAVSVNSAGVIQEPSNFIAANNIVTINGSGGHLKSLQAGTGIIGDDYDGTAEQTWNIDETYITNIVKNLLDDLTLTAPTGERVKISVAVIDGVPVLNPEIVNDNE